MDIIISVYTDNCQIEQTEKFPTESQNMLVEATAPTPYIYAVAGWSPLPFLTSDGKHI